MDNFQEEKEESSSGDVGGCGGPLPSTSSGNFVQTIQCDVTLKVNETIKVILRKIIGRFEKDYWEV